MFQTRYQGVVFHLTKILAQINHLSKTSKDKKRYFFPMPMINIFTKTFLLYSVVIDESIHIIFKHIEMEKVPYSGHILMYFKMIFFLPI